MSCERALNFDQWKTFSENYKPMRVWLWLVYKFTENCQIYRLFSEFIQTKKRYHTSPDKIRTLTRKLLSYQAKIFLVNVTPKERAPCKIPHICRCAFKKGEYVKFRPAIVQTDVFSKLILSTQKNYEDYIMVIL